MEQIPRNGQSRTSSRRGGGSGGGSGRISLKSTSTQTGRSLVDLSDTFSTMENPYGYYQGDSTQGHASAHGGLRRNTSVATDTTHSTLKSYSTQNTKSSPRYSERYLFGESDTLPVYMHPRRSPSIINTRSTTPVQFWQEAMVNTVGRRRATQVSDADTYGDLTSYFSYGEWSDDDEPEDGCGFGHAVSRLLEASRRSWKSNVDRSTKNSDEVKPGEPKLNFFELIKLPFRRLFSSCSPIRISVKRWKGSCRKDERMVRPSPFEQTLRIKNNPDGGCVFQITHDSPLGEEQLTLLSPADLRFFFRFNTHLIKSLEDWNSHYQKPPLHWFVNFIPNAYLRRGFRLAEEMCEYFEAFPDCCRYKIEYEPIGHAPCLVGVVGDQVKKIEGVVKGGGLNDFGRLRHPSRLWQKNEVTLVKESETAPGW